MTHNKFILHNIEPNINPSSEELADVIVQRIGLMPRKKGSTEKMNMVLLEIYEKSKRANREKSPREAIMTVEEMAMHAGITRQTMYDYLKRWLFLELITKTSFVDQNNSVIIGYKLNGNTLESAFEKTRAKIANNMEYTMKYIQELQKTVKNEKISKAYEKKE